MKLSELLSNITRYTRDAVVITQVPTPEEIEQQYWPNIMFVNDAFSALTGYRSEEVIGKPVGIFCANTNDVSLLPDLQATWRKGGRMDAEIQIRTKTDLVRWVEFACASVCDMDGQAFFMVITARDITDRKVMQDATEQQSLAFLHSETRLRAIMNSIADGIITLAEDGHILSISSVAERLFGLDQAEVDGKPFTDLFAPESKAELEAIVTAKMFAQHDVGRLATHELRGLHSSGEFFHARITCSTLRIGAQKTMVIAARDVSQEKEALDALRIARDAAERASRAKSEFLANMSHELRTPMNGILGLAEVLQEAPMEGENREFLEALSGSASSLLTILNDILDFSKIEAGEMALEHSVFSLRGMVDHVRDLLQQIAQKKSLALMVEIPDSLADHYIGDSHRLQQILVNLVGNALKFTSSGHVRIVIDAQHEHEDTALLGFHVYDTGMGIAEDYLPHLFNKFSQADSSNTRKFGGTGLGLAICKQLVSLMEGSMAVESTVGVGSHFSFSIPLMPAAETPLPCAAPASVSLPVERVESSRVLVVEDHPVNLMLLKKLLQKMGFFAVDHAEHGADALSLCRANVYDLIFMDCQMPIMDGYDATRAIRALEHETHRARTPIIAMTANAMVGDREVCMHAGMDGYVSKPIDMVRIQQAILQCWQLDAGEEIACVENDKCSSTDPVDMEHLSMFTDGDAEEERVLFSIFLSNAEHTLQTLRNSAAQQDTSAWSKAAHLLKGASGNLGAHVLYQCCAMTEEKAKTAGNIIWEQDLAAIEAALYDVQHFIEKRAA